MRIAKTSVFLGAVALFLMSACSKEEENKGEQHNSPSDDYFTADITPYGTSAKTYITPSDGLDYSCWTDGDVVNINGSGQTVSISGEVGSYSATISANGVTAVDGGFLAAYPADEVSSNNGSSVTFNIPDTTYYTTIASGVGEGLQLVTAPMVAYTTNRNLSFVNVGSLVQFALKQSGSNNVKLRSITLSTSNRPLSGAYTVGYDGGNWSSDATGLNNNQRTLVCSDPLALSSSPQTLYLYLPPMSGATDFTVDIQMTVGNVRRHFSLTKSSSTTLLAGCCYDFGTLTYNVDAGTLTDNNSKTYTEVTPAGTEADPYRISNAEEWYYWCGLHATEREAHYLFENNFSVTTSIPEFCGTVDGNNHIVTLNNYALIAYLNGGTVKNLTTTGNVKDNQHNPGNRSTCGSIAGYAENATITHCINTATITIEHCRSIMDVGGIVGRATSTTIDKCRNQGAVSTASLSSVTFYAGGIVGQLTGGASSIVSNCANRGNLTVYGNGGGYAGGIVGLTTNSTRLFNSYSTGSVSISGSNAGGFVGSSKSTIQNCYFYNTSISYFCKSNSGTIDHCYHSSTNTVPTEKLNHCEYLTNATTIQGGRSLPDTLNSHRNGESEWSASGGITILDWE